MVAPTVECIFPHLLPQLRITWEESFTEVLSTLGWSVVMSVEDCLKTIAILRPIVDAMSNG